MARSRTARSDNKATSEIAVAGWVLTRLRVDGVGRYVAKKTIHEAEDDSTTGMYESSWTLEGLAKQVVRREREEGFVRRT